MLQVKIFEFNPFQENTYVLFDDSRECVIIDPGCSDAHEEIVLATFVETNKLKVKLLLNTHCHIDHVLGNWFVKKKYQVDLLIHQAEEVVLNAVKVYAPNYGFPAYQETKPDAYLQESDEVKFGNQIMQVLFVPGHAPGHIAFYNANEKILISGDVLFYNSVGRTDLPGGNTQTLMDSIQKKLFLLPDDVTVYPGHGPETTIGFEKKTNPFCALK
jgi:hydroxyacylglutathione hydrolase